MDSGDIPSERSQPMRSPTGCSPRAPQATRAAPALAHAGRAKRPAAAAEAMSPYGRSSGMW